MIMMRVNLCVFRVCSLLSRLLFCCTSTLFLLLFPPKAKPAASNVVFVSRLYSSSHPKRMRFCLWFLVFLVSLISLFHCICSVVFNSVDDEGKFFSYLSQLLFTSCLSLLPVFFAFIAFVCFSLMLSHFRFRLCCISCWICFASHLILRQGLSFQSNTHLFLVVDWLLTCKVWSQLQFMCTFSRFLPLFAKRLNGRKRYSFCPEPCFLFLWFILTLTPSLSLLLVIHLTTFREKGKWLEERKDNWTRGQETSVEASRERTLW